MPQFNGTSGDDNINGTEDTDDIYGFAGNDLLLGRSGPDRLYGGEGNDTIYAGDGGFLGVDWIYDGPGDDMVFGEEDIDIIYASPGNDTYDGGTGATGPFGIDRDSVDYISALAGIVVDLRLSTGQVRSIGNADAAGIGVDTLLNIETIYGSTFDDVMIAANGFQGNSALNGQGGNDTLTGGSGADTLDGGLGNDVIDGGGGTDTAVYGAIGSSVTVSLAISGPQDTGQGIDTLISIENLWGSGGNDLLIGNAGNNWIFGSSGNDVIIGGAGRDDLEDDQGDDVYVFDSESDHPASEITDLGGFNDEIRYSATSAGTFIVYAGDEGLERVVIGTGTGASAVTTGLTALNIDASAAQNGLMIVGNDGANTLLGTAFGDNIAGGGGDDLIVGGAEGDYLTGGTGSDVFRGTKTELSGDVIADFSAGDSIVITDAVFGSFTFDRTGETLTYTGGSLTLIAPTDATIVASAAAGGGVQLTLQAPSTQFEPADLVLNTFGAGASAGGWASNTTYHRDLADVNNDGRADIVAFGQNSVYVALASADGSFGAPNVATSQFTSSIGWSNENRYPRQLADLNGDGRADIVGFGEAGVYVALANANGTFDAATLPVTSYGASAAAGGWTSNNVYLRTLGDVNGDGKVDIVAFGQNNVFVSLGTGDGSFDPAFAAASQFTGAFGWSNEDRYPRMLGDINGDGRADIIGFGEDGVYVAFADANGTFGPATLALPQYGAGAAAGSWTSNNTYLRQVADVDGDGRDDIVAFGQDTVFVALSNENGTFTTHIGTDLFTVSYGWTSNDTTPRILADIDGDGDDDLVGFGVNGVYVAPSYGDIF